MLLLRNFNRQFTIIRLQQFGHPKVAPFSQLELPVGSILHYIPTSGVSEMGPPQSLPILERADKLIQVNHVTKLTENNVLGRPKRVETGINKEVMRYHRTNKKLRRMQDTKLVERDPRTLMVENYALLRRLYRYPQTLMAWYEKWHNLFQTMIEQLGVDADRFDRQNYLLLTVPNTLSSIAKLRRAETKRDKVSLESMTDENSLFFLELWTWLGNNREHSMFSTLTDTQLKRINVIIAFNDKFVNVNLGELDFWRKGSNYGGQVQPGQMQKRLYATVVDLATAALTPPETTESDEGEVATDMSGKEVLQLVDRSDAEQDTDVELDLKDEIEAFEKDDDINEKEDFEIIKQDDSEVATVTIDEEVSVDNGIEKACTKHIEAGTLSTKEYIKLQELSKSYETIPNPFGEGVLKDMLEVKPEEIVVEEEVMLEDETILDKNMAKTTTNQFNRKYINEVLPKDIISSVVATQKAGVVVQDYRVEEVIDAANRLQHHSVKLVPVKGQPATIRFTTPLIDEDGYWTANDIRYTMRKQRVDMPIRKTAPDTVALTSFYGKNFVRRSEKSANNYPKWLASQVVAAGIDIENTKVKELKFSNVFDPSKELPRDYTSLAQRVSGFTSGGVIYSFDAKQMDEIFGVDEVKSLKKQELVPIGKAHKAVYAMDKFSTVYKKTDKGLDELGRITEVVGIDDSKAPKEYTELSMMGKDISLALIFCYYLGLENALKGFKVSYRVADASERVSKEEGDMILALKDSKIILTFDNQEQMLIFQGLKPYLKLMRDFTLHDFNRKDVYLNLIQKDGLTIRYLNELDLMETMFVDPITERILKSMGEPTNFKGLLKRANELVTHDGHPKETDLNHMHIYGAQRIAGAVYTGLVRGIRDYQNKPGVKKKIDIPSAEIWSSIAQDPAVMPASDANPIQSIKEADVVTFGGTGGRSRRSMVKRTREYGENDLGVISGDTVDSGDVAITSYMVGNPVLDNLDGVVKDVDRKSLDVAQYLSAPALLAPGSMYDDDKRVNFIGIQHGSGMAADGYEVACFRTGFEKLVAHRTGPTQANVAQDDGKVIDVDEHGITVEFNTKPKTTRSYPIGKTFGKHEGAVFPHELVTHVKKGDKVSKGDVLTYNSKFFERDLFNQSQVNWKLGCYANTVLLEGVDTLEDSSAISPRLSERLKTQITKVKHITVRFDQAIHELVNVGDTVESDTILCLIEDALTAGSQGFGDKSLETLRRLSAQAPQAKLSGVVDRMEVFYNGDMEDMSESILALAKKGDRLRKKEAKVSAVKIAENGRVDSTLRIDGNPVELDTMVIRLYLTQEVAAIGGDKAVFANQMKTTFRRVMVGTNETADGMPIDAIFGKMSIDNRIVLSVYQIGTTVKVCQLMSEKCQEILAAA